MRIVTLYLQFSHTYIVSTGSHSFKLTPLKERLLFSCILDTLFRSFLYNFAPLSQTCGMHILSFKMFCFLKINVYN